MPDAPSPRTAAARASATSSVCTSWNGVPGSGSTGPIGALRSDSRWTSGPPAREIAAATPPAWRSSVFAAFMLQDNPLIQSIGFALAAAVFLDAFVVRMVLIPAVMYLLGDAAWWLPGWLDRLLPDVDIEGERLTATRIPDDAREVEDETQPVR